jgi:hypothetical protein
LQCPGDMASGIGRSFMSGFHLKLLTGEAGRTPNNAEPSVCGLSLRN